MPLTTIILLTGAQEWPYLSIWLRQQKRDVRIHVAETRADLEAIPDDVLAAARLCAFYTNVIVPSAILDRLGYGACNFHPGSPAYPGWAPAAFAFYDRASEFGATAHILTAVIDAGDIVATELFPVPPDTPVQVLQAEAYRAALALFRRLAADLACCETPLPKGALAWGATKSSRLAFARMCALSPDMPEAEIEKRLAAFGEGDGYSVPTLTLHGRRYHPTEVLPD